jgi:hypothetical protein
LICSLLISRLRHIIDRRISCGKMTRTTDRVEIIDAFKGTVWGRRQTQSRQTVSGRDLNLVPLECFTQEIVTTTDPSIHPIYSESFCKSHAEGIGPLVWGDQIYITAGKLPKTGTYIHRVTANRTHDSNVFSAHDRVLSWQCSHQERHSRHTGWQKIMEVKFYGFVFLTNFETKFPFTTFVCCSRLVFCTQEYLLISLLEGRCKLSHIERSSRELCGPQSQSTVTCDLKDPTVKSPNRH